LTADRCSAHAEASECLNGPNTLLPFSLVRSFTAKGIYLKKDPSGFDPERPVIVDFRKTGPNWLRKQIKARSTRCNER